MLSVVKEGQALWHNQIQSPWDEFHFCLFGIDGFSVCIDDFLFRKFNGDAVSLQMGDILREAVGLPFCIFPDGGATWRRFMLRTK